MFSLVAGQITTSAEEIFDTDRCLYCSVHSNYSNNSSECSTYHPFALYNILLLGILFGSEHSISEDRWSPAGGPSRIVVF